MSFINAIQSLLPRPENRSLDDIARDVEDEIAFHLEMKARTIESEQSVSRQAACGLARQQFGDVERIRRECQSIALKERIMLQRVNFIMMVVVTLLVIGVGVQVMLTQRATTRALQAITADLATMKFDSMAAARDGGAGAPEKTLIYIDGDVVRPGTYALPTTGPLTLARAVKAAGGANGKNLISVKVYGTDSDGIPVVRFQETRYTLDPEPRRDYVLLPRDCVTVSAIDTRDSNDSFDASSKPAAPSGRLAFLAGDAARPGNYTIPSAGVLTIENFLKAAGGTKGGGDAAVTVHELDQLAPRLTIARWSARTAAESAYAVQSGDRITIRLLPDDKTAAAQAPLDARAKAVGDFVVRLFALADPNEPNLDQKIRDFLDNEEKTVDAKYADDPATAGMIKELIAGRRKIFDADAGFRAAASAEARTQAVTSFLQEMMVAVDRPAPGVSVAELVDRASERVDQLAADNPELAATMRERLGQIRPAAAQAGAQSQPAATRVDGAADQGEVRQDDDQFPKVSPFLAVRWKDQWTPVVNIQGQWYELLSLDGIESKAIVEHSRKDHGDESARKRFSEDLAQMLIEMNHQPGPAAKLQVKDLRSGSVLSINQAAMTSGNRELTLKANVEASEAGKAYPEWTGSGE